MKDGFYFVIMRDGSVSIAELVNVNDGELWFIIGSDSTLKRSDFQKIGQLINIPESI